MDGYRYSTGLWLLLWLNSVGWVQGQQSVQGRVVSTETRQPVEGSHIMLQTATDSLVLAFTRTDKAGRFSMNYQLDTTQRYVVKVSHLNFLPAYQPLVFTTISVQELTFQLTQKAFELAEVQVTVRRPIRQQGDSTLFRVDAYNTSNARSLEEVLRRMPNIRVEDNGDIYFKNKKVERVYLDGDDLIGDRYQSATRSINPSVLNEVQAIENFTENRLLKAVSQSTKTVLNLTVKDQFKTLLFGSADLAVSPRYTDAQGTLYSYHRRYKAFSALSGNNVGVQRTQPLPITAPVDYPAPDLAITRLVEPGFVGNRSLNSPLENFNNERTVLAGLSVEPLRKLKLTANLALSRDLVRVMRSTETQFLIDQPIFFGQADTLRHQPQQASWQGKAVYEASSLVNWTYKGRWQQNHIANQQATFFTQIGTRSFFPQQAVMASNLHNHLLEFTYQYKPGTVVQAAVQYAKHHIFETLNTRLQPRLSALLDGLSDSITELTNQQLNQQEQTMTGYVAWLQRLKNRKLDLRIGYDQTRFLADLGQRAAGDTLRSFQWNSVVQRGYVRAQVRQTGGKLELTATAELALLLARINQKQEQRAVGQTNVSLTYRASDLGRLIVAADQQTRLMSNSSTINQLFLTSYQTAQAGRDELMLNRQFTLTGGYVYSDPITRKMTLQGVVTYARFSTFWGLADFLLAPEYSVLRLIDTPGLQTMAVTLTAEKLIYALAGNTRIDIRLFQNQADQVINGTARLNQSQTATASIRHITALDRPLNIEFSGAYRRTIVAFETNGQKQIQSVDVGSLTSRLIYKRKQFQASLTGETTWFGSNWFVFVKANSTYKISPKLSLGIDAANLLNENQFRLPTLTPISRMDQVYPLRERFLMLYGRFNF